MRWMSRAKKGHAQRSESASMRCSVLSGFWWTLMLWPSLATIAGAIAESPPPTFRLGPISLKRWTVIGPGYANGDAFDLRIWGFKCKISVRVPGCRHYSPSSFSTLSFNTIAKYYNEEQLSMMMVIMPDYAHNATKVLLLPKLIPRDPLALSCSCPSLLATT